MDVEVSKGEATGRVKTSALVAKNFTICRLFKKISLNDHILNWYMIILRSLYRSVLRICTYVSTVNINRDNIYFLEYGN